MASAPPPPPGFVADPVITRNKRRPATLGDLTARGAVHDGDTFGLSNGQSGRLYGVDAFELNQPGYRASGPYNLGELSREELRGLLRPGMPVSSTGNQSWGRPVVSLGDGKSDPALSLLDSGYALAAPDYLRGDQTRLGDYMEAERYARMNRHGAHAGKFQPPEDYRKGVPDPWAKAEFGTSGVPVFWDERTPFQGLRPEIEQGYQAIWTNPKSTPDDLLAYAKDNGFTIDPDVTRKAYAEREKRGKADPTVRYEAPPRLLTDGGGGTLGSFGRGLIDPINMLDEMGGVAASVGLLPGRENVWNSDRRFGDILWNNVDQNRSVLAYDDANHPWARFGGQLASGLALPGASVEGVGLAAARQALRTGGSRLAAEAAAKSAVRNRLMLAGGIEGSLAGAGAGEDWQSRLTGAGIGGTVGSLLGYGTGALGQEVLPRLTGRARQAVRTGGEEVEGVALDEATGNVPAPPAGFTMDMAAEGPPAIDGPRLRDVIDVASRPRPMAQGLSEAQMRAQGERVMPSDMLPGRASDVQSVDEAAGIDAGRYAPVKAPDENRALGSRSFPSPSNPDKTVNKRGPLDLVSWVRSQGGLADEAELRAMGLDNRPRDLELARGEQRLGRFVDPEKGMSLDDAARRAWEAGYFPNSPSRPSINEFLDALDATHRGSERAWRPDDLAELDSYYAAQEQRQAVERAAQDGVTWSQDRSAPAGEDRPFAPVEAHEDWPAGGPDFAGNINLGKLDTPQDISRALAQTESRVGFDSATRGRVTQAETQRLANEMGMTADQLLARRKGHALNAEQALAARQILAKSGNELVNLARKVQRLENPGDDVLAEFRRGWLRHVAIQEQVAGATAEAGRALQQFKMTADSRMVTGDVLGALVNSAGGMGRIKDAADMIVDLVEDPGKLNSFTVQAAKPKWRDKFVELWYNTLLSGPQTHAVNMLSNTLTSLGQLPEHAAAATLGGVRNMIGKGDADRVLFSELGARSVGLLQGTKEGLRQFVRTLRTGEPTDQVTKVEQQSMKAISGLKGEVIRVPTRLLSAEDELFKAMARRMELNGLAVRQAGKEGLKGEAAAKRAAELVANPPDDMLAQAFDYGRYLTFQRPLGSVGSKISGITQDWPGLKLVVPFVRTPANLLKFALERSPAAPLLKEWRKDVMAGGAKRDLAIARAAVGSGFGALMMEMAANGQITGAPPSDRNKARLLYVNGWQPYSIKVGDEWVSYQRLDPFSSTFGIAADLATKSEGMSEKQRENAAVLFTASIMANLTSKTWLSGLSDALAAINEPEMNAERFLKRLGGSMAVPAAVAQVARTLDPYQRDTETVGDYVRSRVPFASQGLPERLDVWGQPIANEGGLGPDIVSPLWLSRDQADPVTLAALASGATVGIPQQGDMTLGDYQRFRSRSGALAKQQLAPMVLSDTFGKMTPQERRALIEKAVRNARSQTRKRMFGGSAGKAIPAPPPGFTMEAPPAGFVVDR